ncbi:BON domain-containing protein [candidate division KSB1 bacterium]|nr:BON domain-containing protein [candidate division KSB1 bacterium]NIR68969.1 BON domain-containing protein [candidate division KSB1 bacterium]NIS26755.1 BON domain-containing protein [candidate division KSB1 bacterium]NIT73503.1 BON domain-containing protein [candidate division KSB1 bacterium]NIU24694.1 BON domain-containing protein [candidate division KSB1 bacterium]
MFLFNRRILSAKNQASVLTVLLVFTLTFLCIALVEDARAVDERIADKDISDAIQYHLIVDPNIPGNELDVQTIEGVVTLSGSVSNLLAKNRTLEIARTIKGVRAVVDHISVEPMVRTDKALREDVVRAFLSDPATEAYEIDVSVEEGVVTLTGEVASWQEKELCTKVVRSVEGVREIENKIEFVVESERPDVEIKEEIARHLDSDIWVDEQSIEVNVENGKVELSGHVGSVAERARAYTNAWVTGVHSVDASTLSIDWTAADQILRKDTLVTKSDTEIKNAVRDAFLYDPRVTAFKPEIEVEDGTVTLTGRVGDLKAKQAAEKDARNTVGVWRVRNLLKVRPESPFPDEKIVKNIQEAIAREPILKKRKLDVSVYDGHVHINGTVNSDFEKRHAKSVVAGVRGVVDVRNNLIVPETRVWKSDWEIKQDIKSELFWNPFVASENITVEVSDGIATLTGTVDSWNEYRLATKEAYKGNAKKVANRLAVKRGPEELRPKDLETLPVEK